MTAATPGTPRPAHRRGARGVASDLAAAAGGALVSLVLLWYVHGAWEPRWALLCGGLSGIVFRRLVEPSYASFPAYLRNPIDKALILLGTIVTSWATLVREPSSYWLLRWREAVTLPALAVVLGLGVAGVIYSHARMRREIEEARAREAALREAALHARLRALQAQINPHFLFNAFNALAELTHDDPAVAEQLVGDLAHLLRYTLRSSAEGTVPLFRELDAVGHYIRVEKARLGERLRFEQEVDPAALQRSIPGLVLQPLVENAVQHAVATRAEGGTVRIGIECAAETLVVRVEDDGPGLPVELQLRLAASNADLSLADVELGHGTGGAGGGLSNVMQRLALRYRGAATLAATPLDPGTRIEMRIPS